jgi:hypothetical protein
VPLDVPLAPPLELLVELPLDALPAASSLPPPALLTPLLLPPLLPTPLLLAPVFASVPPSEVVNAVPPHSGIASAIVIAHDATPRVKRPIEFFTRTRLSEKRPSCRPQSERAPYPTAQNPS